MGTYPSNKGQHSTENHTKHTHEGLKGPAFYTRSNRAKLGQNPVIAPKYELEGGYYLS